MFRIIRKAVKWTLITIGAVITTGGVILALLLQIDVDVKPSKQQVAKVQAPVETAKHTACRLKLHSENPYGGTYNGLSNLVWDTDAFGTYNDGSVWVGYNRKVGDKVFYNMSKIC